jgi:hypothetical protein
MTALLRSYAVLAWAILMGLTAISWWVGSEHDVGGMSMKTATSLVLIAAFAKVALVGHSFMELRHAARPLQLAFWGWCVMVATVVVTIYLTG